MPGQLVEGKLWGYLCWHWNHLKYVDIEPKTENKNLDRALLSHSQLFRWISHDKIVISLRGIHRSCGFHFSLHQENAQEKAVFSFTGIKGTGVIRRDQRKTRRVRSYPRWNSAHKPASWHKGAAGFPVNSLSLHKEKRQKKKCAA